MQTFKIPMSPISPDSTTATLEIFTGCMKSGKTTGLLDEKKKFEIAGEGVLYFTYYKDHVLKTHNEKNKESPIGIKRFSELLNYKYDFISLLCVDEGKI